MSNKIKKLCKICGKPYIPCFDCEKDTSIFHWRRVACSKECAAAYFTMVEKAREK